MMDIETTLRNIRDILEDDEAMYNTVGGAVTAMAHIRAHRKETAERIVVVRAFFDDPRGALALGANLDEDIEVVAAFDGLYRKLIGERDAEKEQPRPFVALFAAPGRKAILREGYELAVEEMRECEHPPEATFSDIVDQIAARVDDVLAEKAGRA